VIVKGREGKGGIALARYLEGGKNEHAEVLEFRNMKANSLKHAIFRMDQLAERSQCQNHAYHVVMRAAPGERLSADLWRDAVDRVAEAFGMEDNQAAIVLHHQQDGCTHCHIVFNRVHPEKMIAADLWRNQFKHKALARQMEIDYGLQIVTDLKRDKARDYSNAGMKEEQQAHRSGENVHDIRDQIRSAWEQSDNGQSFAAALEASGFTLAKGDKRDFVAINESGVYSIGQRTTGAPAREVRKRLADLNPAHVPSVAEVKLAQDLALVEEEKLAKERKGRGEGEGASAAHAPTPDWNEAQQSKEKPRAVYADTRAGHTAQWEAAAAARVDRLREKHAREYEIQQQGFDKVANLETGAAVKEFNDLKRCDETNTLLKSQAEELAQELQRQQIKREDYAAMQIWRDYSDEQRETLKAIHAKPQFRKGGFKQRLRDELTQQREESSSTYTESDMIKEERARNQAARERQEAARQHHNNEPTAEKPQDTASNDNDRDAKIAARLKQYHEDRAAKSQSVGHGKKLKPHLGEPKP
jgi:hypothetical protein